MAAEPPLRLLIDTDIGTDDAIALVLAARHTGVRVELVTTVAGNTTVENATRNALYVLKLCGIDAPVCAGADRPLRREPYPPRLLHGRDGLGDLGFPPPQRSPTALPVSEALAQRVRQAPGKMTLVTLGPLTNVALALRGAPALAAGVRRCIVMGGILDPGTPPDFNLWADAEAAVTVLRSGMPIILVPLDLSGGAARVAPDVYAAMLSASDPVARFTGLMCQFLGRQGVKRYGWNGEAAIPDAVAMSIALDPDIATEYADGDVHVETHAGAEYGRLRVTTRPAGSVRVITGIDVGRFHAGLHRALGLAQ